LEERFDDGTMTVLSVDEINVGHWFDVFPLLFHQALPDYLSHYHFKWVALPAPLEICGANALWREEWRESAQDNGQFLGSGPHFVQYAAPLQGAPPGVPTFQVEAGIALQGTDGRRLFICSSDSTPFKIGFATEATDIEKIMLFHSLQ
jgi:hypothetical protein